MNTADQLKNSLMLYSSDIWKDRHAGPHTNQQEQQFSDVSAGCAASFQVRESVFLLLTEELSMVPASSIKFMDLILRKCMNCIP